MLSGPNHRCNRGRRGLPVYRMYGSPPGTTSHENLLYAARFPVVIDAGLELQLSPDPYRLAAEVKMPVPSTKSM